MGDAPRHRSPTAAPNGQRGCKTTSGIEPATPGTAAYAAPAWPKGAIPSCTPASVGTA